MRAFAPLCLILVAFLAAPAAAQEVSPADRAAIRQVIESQLAAFQRDDGAEAFSYAAPMIQQRFGDPATFMEMVRSGYRPVYRPREVEFRESRAAGPGRIDQAVLFVGPDGEAVIALYRMEQQPDGAWRIAGVAFVEANETTA